MRFIGSISIGLVVFAFFLFSCKSTESEDKILKLWIFNNSPNPLDDMNKILKPFHIENPGIKVEITVLDWGTGFSKIILAAATRNGPDVIQVPSTWAASFTDLNILIPLDSALETWGGQDVFLEPSRKTMQPNGSNHITSLPWFLDVRPFYFRRDVLNSLNVKPESIKKRDDFLNVLRKIKEEAPSESYMSINPMASPAKNDWNIVHNFAAWIFGAGGSFLNEDLTQSNLLDPKTLDGIYFYLNLIKYGYNDYSNLDKNTAQVSRDFDQGRTAFITETTSKSMYLDNSRFLQGDTDEIVSSTYACMVPPTMVANNKKFFLGGSNLGVFNSTLYSKEALALVRYLTMQQDIQFHFSRLSGFLPSLTATYNLPYFSENENRKIFQEIVHNGVNYPAVSYWGTLEANILTKRFNNIFEIISNSKGDIWPEEKIYTEIRIADGEINYLIRKESEKKAGIDNEAL